MYLLDFFKRLFRKSNIPTIIYLILNVFVVCSLTMAMFADALHPVIGFLLGILLYVGSLAIALSSFGENLLRLQTGCRTITDQEVLNFIMPIFNEVYQKARQQDPSIPEDVQLFMNQDKEPNAFATGRRTVCVTAGMMQKPADQIKAALGHEFGHLSHKDTDLILLITISNFFITIIITFIKIMMLIFRIIIAIASEDWAGALIGWLSTISVDLALWLWTQIGTLLVLKSSRSNEYEADAFSARLGYSDSLCALLASLGGGHAKGLFATLQSSHPKTEDRIARIKALPAEAPAVQRLPGAETSSGTYKPGITGGAAAGSYGRQIPTGGSMGAPVPAPGFVDGGTRQKPPVQHPGATVTCAHCGKVLPEAAKFCTGCGSPVVKAPAPAAKLFCPGCGKELSSPTAKFCTKCGAKIMNC